ncbi:MAG: DNA polymerase III subunit gamma/tau [Pseudomonadota bacterium]
MTQVLARKWRPKNFDELVGQEHVVKALSNALIQNRLHHAYLMTGTRGVGKTTLARIIAKALNCEQGVTATPCGKCAACVGIGSGRFVDLIELDAASNTQVDSMRELLESALYAPTSGRYKVYIIDEVHMLSKSAFNAMLKTLEEPPAHVIFILATTDPQKIPVTVLSRCMQFNLKQIPPQQIRNQLQYVLEQEGIACEPGALPLLARAAAGSMRDALSLLDQAIAHGGGRVEEVAVRAMLGAVDQTYLFSLLKALAARDATTMLAEAERMSERSIAFDAALQDLGVLLHRIALAQTVPAAIPDDEPEREVLFELAAVFAAEDVQLYYQIALQGRGDLTLAPDEYAGFTMTLLRMLAFAPEERGARSQEAGAPAMVASVTVPATAARSAGGVLEERAVTKLAPARAVVPSQPASTFDGDWPMLVGKLKLGGMAKMLAQHCELKRHEGGRMDLVVPEAHKHLLEKAYREKLQAALEEYFGDKLRIEFSIGAGGGNTPVEVSSREKEAKQAQAVAVIEQDPFVRELVENFDAHVVESSIKPVQ